MAPLVTRRQGFAELSHFELDPPSIRLLPRVWARRNAVVVLGKVDPRGTERVVVGALHPENEAVLAEVAGMLTRPVEGVRLNLYEIDRALRVGYEPDTRGSVDGVRRISLNHPPARADADAAEIIDAMLAEAVRLGASDLHFEVFADDVDLRYRIDGILHEMFTHASPANAPEVVSRIKVLAELDIAEKRRPQDGRFRAVFVEGDRFRPVDFRVSVLPGPAGEDVVLRVLDPNQGLLTVHELGMAPAVEEEFVRLLANPEGMLLVTGPTGCGKTTTLYSALAHMSDQQRKIMTAEDPIEYTLDRINQKQVTPQMPFGELLRALLRQNPDAMLFGEIRDLESASTAVNASATGHLVMGTLHTSDALGVVLRLRGIGLEDADIAASLIGAVGQRLVRRICPSCRAPAEPTEEQRRLLGALLDGVSASRGAGCAACRGTGYKGRVGVYELMLVGEELQDLIAEGAPRHELRQWLAERGFRTMAHDALDKVGVGATTLDELVRVIPYRQLALTRQDRESGRFGTRRQG